MTDPNSGGQGSVVRVAREIIADLERASAEWGQLGRRAAADKTDRDSPEIARRCEARVEAYRDAVRIVLLHAGLFRELVADLTEAGK